MNPQNTDKQIIHLSQGFGLEIPGHSGHVMTNVTHPIGGFPEKRVPLHPYRDLFIILLMVCTSPAIHAVEGWLNWRGPDQNGTSMEKNLPGSWQPGGEADLWQYPLTGRGTPVTAGNRVFAWGYNGEGAGLQEVLACLDLETGALIWERRFNDFISDIIYNRYSIGSPTVDAETGYIYLMTTNGLFMCLDPDGNTLWEHSMMEAFGRLTFPNGRTGAPVIDDDLVIVRGITTNWGKQGPARDRFYAFQKKTGRHVWASTPGVAPKDSSFSTPVLDWDGNRRVLYAGTGCGNVVCINARTGDPLWRYQFLTGGINSSVVLWKDRLVAIHGKENLDDSTIGRMIALPLDYPGRNEGKQVVVKPESELWRNRLGIFTSSPVLVNDTIYQVVATGELHSVDVKTGEINWSEKLDNSQLHASPLWADDKLYIPMHNGLFYILKPGDDGAEILTRVHLEGKCLGSPSVWKGRIFVHTTGKLYCFGNPSGAPASGKQSRFKPEPGQAARLQTIPSEVLLRPGQEQSFTIHALDQNGNRVSDVTRVAWEKFLPPTAKVKARLDADFNASGRLVAKPDASLSAGAFKATAGDISGTIRGRILPDLPISEDFEGFDLKVPHKKEKLNFAYPPLPWIGARFKWEIREQDGNKALAKTLDRVLFQRSTVFIGHPDMKNYTMQLDLMSEGGRRGMAEAGIINQRYLVTLKGSHQLLEVSSNHERIKESVPFKWKPRIWYRLKTNVDVRSDGSGVIRARTWNRDDPEPDQWMIEVEHKHANRNGSPGLFGFSPQSKIRVYLDNILVTPND
jgi:outer membrane protein assembly factor BamB